MFAPRSPKPSDKRKRSGADSEPLKHTAASAPRHSPTFGHENAQALSQRQWEPFIPDTSRDEAHQGQLGLPGRFDTFTSYGNHASAHHSTHLRVASEPRSPHRTAEEAQDDRFNSQIQRSDGQQDNTACREPARPSIELGHKENQYDRNESSEIGEDYVPRLVRGRVPDPRAITQTPSGRDYLHFEDGEPTSGLVIPDKWTKIQHRGKDRYPCPVRDCTRLFEWVNSLKVHFNKAHCECLFNDNHDGTLSIVGKREGNGQGRVVISQNPLSSEIEPSAEPQMGKRAPKKTRIASSDLSSSSPQSSPRHAASVRARNDQPVESTELATAWDVVNNVYECVPTVFTSCPQNAVITFLAGLPGTEQALEVNTNEGFSRKNYSTRQFRLPVAEVARLVSLKAALAQAHGSTRRTPCPRCAAGKGLWKICMQAPAMPNKSQDVLGGACPSCFYARSGLKCQESSAAASDLNLAPLRPMPATDEYMTMESFSHQHAESVDNTRHEISSSLPPTRMHVASKTSKEPPLVSVSQHRRDGDPKALSAEDVSAEHVQGEAFPRAQSGNSAAQGPWPIHRAQDEAISQQQPIVDHAQGVPAGVPTAQDTIWQFQDMAWGLVRRSRELPANERGVLIDQFESVLSMTSLGPDFLVIANRVSELPVERRAEVIRMIIDMLRHFMG